ncbi:hypothetical protein ATANTOWER_021216 [Ataeniobius toweri]|uniref:Uncharacterized protein n=1 Tax=Ataeniobius toweri TaxID=208326 RepID=A0ABU7BV82_9TELE|nr:hypothetical protein [Ataeniobius toweri]
MTLSCLVALQKTFRWKCVVEHSITAFCVWFQTGWVLTSIYTTYSEHQNWTSEQGKKVGHIHHIGGAPLSAALATHCLSTIEGGKAAEAVGWSGPGSAGKP